MFSKTRTIFFKEVKIVFSNKSKAANAEWKIITFKQKKAYCEFHNEIQNISHKDRNKQYTLQSFLLKKNIRSDIIKTILEYLSIAVPELFKE